MYTNIILIFSVSFFHILFSNIRTYRATLLWNYLQVLLNDSSNSYLNVIRWLDRFQGIFKIMDPAALAELWGQHKNLTGMNYDKLSRSLRNYYKTNKLRKVAGQRQVYQFIFSEKNPPQMDPQVGYFIEQTNQIKQHIINQQSLEVIQKTIQSLTPSKTAEKSHAQKSQKNDTAEGITSNNKDISDLVKTLEFPIEVDIKEEPMKE